MHQTVYIRRGKRRGQSLMTASEESPHTRRLFMTDKATKIRYLIDTGSDVSVYPPTRTTKRRPTSSYQLFAANGSSIHTYGTVTLQHDFGLRRAFPWRFVIADVTHAIIGSDF